MCTGHLRKHLCYSDVQTTEIRQLMSEVSLSVRHPLLLRVMFNVLAAGKKTMISSEDTGTTL